MIDLRKEPRGNLKRLSVGDEFIDEYGDIMIVQVKEIGQNGELKMAYKNKE